MLSLVQPLLIRIKKKYLINKYYFIICVKTIQFLINVVLNVYYEYYCYANCICFIILNDEHKFIIFFFKLIKTHFNPI